MKLRLTIDLSDGSGDCFTNTRFGKQVELPEGVTVAHVMAHASDLFNSAADALSDHLFTATTPQIAK